MPTYCRHRREFPKSNPDIRVGVAAWTVEIVAEKLERARQRQVTRRQPVAWESVDEEDKILPVSALCQHGDTGDQGREP